MELLHDMLDQIERQRLTKMVNEIPDHDLLDSRSVARVTRRKLPVLVLIITRLLRNGVVISKNLKWLPF